MWAKCMLLIMCVGVVVASADEYDGITLSPLHQLPCIKVGGICLKAGNCPEGKSAGQGRCPMDDEGRECCRLGHVLQNENL